MNPTDDYNPKRKVGEGYYTNVDNNADDAATPPVWEESKIPDYKSPAEDESEKTSILQPLSYLRRADLNFFGGRTAFYNQVDSEINEKEGVQISTQPHYDEKNGLWMGPSLIQIADLPVEKAADKIQDSWASVMEGNGHMNLRTDYESKRVAGEGYYTLHSNNAAEANVKGPWASEEIPAPPTPAEGETERVQVLQPMSYLRRADTNFFGGRTAWYSQLDSDLEDKSGVALEKIEHAAEFKSGVWMEPTMI